MILQTATVSGHSLALGRPVLGGQVELPTGSVGVDAVSITFTGDEWNAFTTKNAQFWVDRADEIYEKPISNGQAAIPEQILLYPGIVHMAIKGEDGAGNVITTNEVAFTVKQGGFSSVNAPAPSASMFEEAVVAGVQAAVEQEQSASAAAATAAAEAANSAAASANSASGSIMQLYHPTGNAVSSIVLGSTISLSGAAYANTKRARTNLLMRSEDSISRLAVSLDDADYEYAIALYGSRADLSDGTGFISYQDAGDETSWFAQKAVVDPDAYFFALAFRRSDNAVMSSADITAISAALTIYAETDETLSKSRVPADAKAVGDVLDAYVRSRFETVNPVNWHDTDADTLNNKLLPDGTTSSDTTRYYTDYIPVAAGDVVRAFSRSSLGREYIRGVCAYDAEKLVISGGTSSAAYTYTVPAGVAYVRLTLESQYRLSSGNPATEITINKASITAWEDYFAPYLSVTQDFLTPDTAAAIGRVTGGELTAQDFASGYGVALPARDIPLRMTVGLAESWHKYNMVLTPHMDVDVSAGIGVSSYRENYVYFGNSSAVSSVNGFKWRAYDAFFGEYANNLESNVYGNARKVLAENLPNCSALVIGDSTVAFGTMTQAMLDYFTSKSKTLTLLGTRGTAPNRHEGRAGAKAVEYVSSATVAGYSNPFYNDGFDFSYYMNNQSYASVDYVVIQLGINDLYNGSDDDISATWNAVKTMIQSIHAYNADIKILLNLPTPPNSDATQHSIFLPAYRSRVLRYNQLASYNARSYSKTRTTYCHLILDPATDINDNVHPTEAGFIKMAKEVINQINVWTNE